MGSSKVIKSALEAVANNPAFKRLFGASKVADEAGPMRVYHGTNRDFDEFSGEHGPYRGGIQAFVSTSPDFASGYAGTGEGANVMPLWASINDPYDFRIRPQAARDFYEETGGIRDEVEAARILAGLNKLPEDVEIFNGVDPSNLSADDFYEAVKAGSWDALEAPEFVEWLRGAGHDGIVTLENGAVNYGVFDPRQLKSAISNEGTFDPMDPRIRKAGGGIIRSLVGGVAKEAPELARGAATARRAVVNIGLDIPGGGRITPEEALAAVQRMGVKPLRATVAQSDTEPTLVLELDRALRPDEAEAVSTMLQQEAIAQVDETGAGDLFGPMADKWRPFNGDYFIDPDGKRLTQQIMEAGDPNAVPGGAEPDPVLDRLNEIAAGLRQEEPVEYQEGGPVRGRAGLAYKLGAGLVDMLDFSGVAGRPRTVKIPGRGEVAAAPIAELDEAAEAYMKKHGIPGTHRIDQYPEFDEEFAARIAEYYDKAKHDPFDPAVRRAYDAQIEETLAQYAAAKDTGIDFKFLKEGEADPYAASPSLGYADILENGRMYTFPSDLGFGSNAAFDATQNPMLTKVGRIGDKPDAVANDAFRIIHDLYGHYGPGNPFFRPPGEERAWQHHSRMFSDEALPAMTADTRGHTSWAGFHPSVKDHNRTASSKDTIYADQKAIAFPDWAIEENLGRKLKKADGGPVKMSKAGAVWRALEEAAKYFAPKANKTLRDDVINNTDLRGDGRKFKEFFADVTSGKSEKYKPSGLDSYDPAITLGDDAARFRTLRDSYSGNFDNHIKTSIPGFDETQNAVGSALLKAYGRDGADILDIGSSEGALIKALSNASEGSIRTTGLDPNPDMLRTFRDKPQAEGAQSVLGAFGSADDAGKLAWEEADGTPINFFDPKGQLYDATHEAMVFQFISNARRAQAERAKQLLKPKGIAIFEEKFGGPKAIFDANEAKKDLYKAKYYTPEQLEIKRKEVLNTGNDAVEGMTDLQVSQAEMERILQDTFKNRAQFWDSGNFKGYVGSDDKRALEDFLNNLQSLDSEYATGKTPRGFAEGGRAMSEEDIASMTHEDSYGTGREMNYLETLGQKVPLGEMNFYDVDGERRKPEGVQALHDLARMGVYGVPMVGPAIGATLDTTEAIANDDPLSAGMAVAFGPGGKKAKGALTSALAYGMDPAEAEAGVFGRLGKWAMSRDGKLALYDARRMEGIDNAPSAEIMKATGWFRDIDGQWKYYRPSAGGSLDLSQGKGRLGDVLDDPHLFEEYPHMKTTGFGRKNKEGAHYEPSFDRIVLGDTSKPGYNTPDAGGQYGAVLHEAYHGKANWEGWPQGIASADGKVKVAQDMRRFLNAKQGTPTFNLGVTLSARNHGDGLGFARYEAEMGEALARREAAMREVGDRLATAIPPSNPNYLDVPKDALFSPTRQATPAQYRALLQYLDDKAVANDMMAAQGDVYFEDVSPMKGKK